MSTAAASLPAIDRLQSAVGQLFTERRPRGDSVEIIDRSPNVQTSTFQSEVITCRATNGEQWSVFCKYGGEVSDKYGHRGGVELEASVYREVLTPLSISTPDFYGCHSDESGKTYLFLQALDPLGRLEYSPHPLDDLIRAVRWIGQFHALNEPRVETCSDLLNRYDVDYFAGWARRTVAYAGTLNDTFPWLRRLAEVFEREFAPALAADRPTIIHGEYYPKNILLQDQIVHPVDWESAAVATGAIDLATLVDGWDDESVSRCEQAYCAARWAGKVPESFSGNLMASRLYAQFRWLGDWPELTQTPRMRPHLDRLHDFGTRMGII